MREVNFYQFKFFLKLLFLNTDSQIAKKGKPSAEEIAADIDEDDEAGAEDEDGDELGLVIDEQEDSDDESAYSSDSEDDAFDF